MDDKGLLEIDSKQKGRNFEIIGDGHIVNIKRIRGRANKYTGIGVKKAMRVSGART